MKYLLLIHGNKELWESFTPEQTGQAIAAQEALNRELTATGELLGAYGLADQVMARTIRIRDGIPAVTDGPYLEATEYVSSLSLLDVADQARALEIAAMTPFASVRQVELWPVMHESGEA